MDNWIIKKLKGESDGKKTYVRFMFCVHSWIKYPWTQWRKHCSSCSPSMQCPRTLLGCDWYSDVLDLCSVWRRTAWIWVALYKTRQTWLSYLRNISTLGADNTQSLCHEWRDDVVETIQTQQQLSWNKILKHNKALTRKHRKLYNYDASRRALEIMIAQQNVPCLESTFHVCWTVYSICTAGCPVMEYPSLAYLQVLNWIDLGLVLYCGHSCVGISAHIPDGMRAKSVSEIGSKQLKIGIMIVESPSVSKTAVPVICVRVYFTDADEVTSVFFTSLTLARLLL